MPSPAASPSLYLFEQRNLGEGGREWQQKAPRLYGECEELAARDPWRSQAIGSAYVLQRQVPRREGTVETAEDGQWEELGFDQKDSEAAQRALNCSVFIPH